MIDRGGVGHSQEVVRSASGHVGLAAAGGGVKLKAGRGKNKSHEPRNKEATTNKLV